MFAHVNSQIVSTLLRFSNCQGTVRVVFVLMCLVKIQCMSKQMISVTLYYVCRWTTETNEGKKSLLPGEQGEDPQANTDTHTNSSDI